MKQGNAPLHENARPPSPPSRGVRDGSLRSISRGASNNPRCGLRLAPRAALAWGGPAQTLRSFIDGSPHFAKPSIDDGKKVKIAAIDPDFELRPRPLSLMEYAGRCLITLSCSKHSETIRLNRPRSDLSRHHVMIARAIGGGSPFEVGCRGTAMPQGFPPCRAPAVPLRGSKPEPQKIPSLQIQPGQQRVQVDHLAAALERVVSIK
jgi:hypothetical protein